MIVHRYDVLESTNLELMKMAGENASPWTVVLADSQAGGMGRSGRAWWSPPGGLYMSVLIKPSTVIEVSSRIPILASLAVLDAVRSVEVQLRVKWPNDILLSERKLAGILIQARMEGKKPAWIVAGFGVNIHRPDGKIPEELRDRIAFLEDLCGDITRDRLAEAIATGLRGRLLSLDEVEWKRAMDEWTRYASWNTVYTHRDGGRVTRGVPVRLAWDGGLVLMTDRGEITVHSGELIESVQRPTSNVQR